MARGLRLAPRWLACCCAGGLAACLPGKPREAAPAEIPELAARLAREPDNAALRARYAAALFAADQCEQATEQAQLVRQRRPSDAVATLVIGQCAEKAQRYEDALAAYRGFLAEYGEARGSAAIRAREQLALRAFSLAQARLALQNEAQLAAQPGDPSTLAVLPLTIATTDTSLAPLGVGLAQMITSDLSLIRRFRLVERLRLAALLDELRLAQTERVDPNTAARVGRLVQAGRLVQGLANLPPAGEVRLEGSVVAATGEVTAPEVVSGRFRDLLRLEKELVVALAARLGYQLAEAERRLLLENGTQNLTAFLAYSKGLLAEDAGDFQRAAAYFSDAVRADPNFQAARESYQAASVATQVQQASPSQVTAVASQQPPPPAPPENTLNSAVNNSVGDVAGTTADQTKAGQSGQQGGNTPGAAPPPTPRGEGTPSNATGTIRIVFRLP
jgi:tetratricopeptide (TPR) repeat protein